MNIPEDEAVPVEEMVEQRHAVTPPRVNMTPYTPKVHSLPDFKPIWKQLPAPASGTLSLVLTTSEFDP